MNVYKKIVVCGRVQGVFFRESTRQLAFELALKGGVRNLLNGCVEVRVSGEKEKVESLIKWLKTGPKYAKVSTIEVIDLPADSQPGQQSKKFEVWTTN